MKKILCIVLAAIVLFTTPVRGYSAGVSLPFGIGEEIILPFLLSLLGVKAAESVDTYNDLVTYNEKIKGSLLEKVSGLAGMEQVQEWLFKVVNGVIDTDSVIWEKLYEYAISQYSVSSGSTMVPSDNILSVPSFDYVGIGGFNNGTTYYTSSYDVSMTAYATGTQSCRIIAAYSSNVYFRAHYANGRYNDYGLNNSYKYNGLTVYWNYIDGTDLGTTVSNTTYSGINYSKIAWLMIYGNYLPTAANDALYSDAFENVLTDSEKEDIVDGSNVIQLYNPAELQNGLEIIPGGDPEDDPNLKKIPFAVTADWWNFLQQFGSGNNSNQYVNAYNALNGLENTSVGRISDAYDSLGIASIAGSAANAAEGIISLTDDNIYPASQTAADAITNTIPGSLTPQTPDSGIDNESPQGLYNLPDLREYFPFCIPFDLIDLLRCFVAEPETPSFVLALSTGSEMSEQSFDLHMWDNIASMVRTFELVGFILGLILVTRNIIRG